MLKVWFTCHLGQYSQDSSVGSALDWYHGGWEFKSRQERGFFRSKFDLQYMQPARRVPISQRTSVCAVHGNLLSEGPSEM